MQHLVWGAFFLLCAALGVWEISRWRDPMIAQVVTAGHRRRRITGLALLLAISSMGYHSVDLPLRHISKLLANEEIVYFGVMGLLVVGAIAVGYLEWKATLLEVSQERSRAIASAIAGLAPAGAPNGVVLDATASGTGGDDDE